jgi:hypothetical protein
MRTHIVIIAVITLAFCACQKHNITHYTINADLKAAFNYQVGTYWIYRDSVSGTIDSFYVTKNESGTSSVLDHNGDGYTNESIAVYISEQNINPVLADTANEYWEYHYQSSMFNMNYFSLNKTSVQLFPLIDYPFESTLSGSGPPAAPPYYQDGHVISISNSYTLNGNTFTNVAVVNHIANASALQYNDVFYISQSAGIFKMRLNHPLDTFSRVWELQRWKIVK